MREPVDVSQPEVRFTNLYEKHYIAVEAYVRRRAPTWAIQDILAETFAAAWVNVEQLDLDCLPWLYRAAWYEISRYMRMQNRRSSLVDKIAPLLDAREEDVADLAADQDVLVRAFSTLDETDREILRLVAWEGLNTREGAKRLGCTSATFRVRLYRARERLVRSATESGEERASVPKTMRIRESRQQAALSFSAINPLEQSIPNELS